MRALVCLTLVLGAPGLAFGKKTLHAEAKAGTLWSSTPDGWKPLPNATVKLTCVASEAPGEKNHWRNTCDSTLR